MQERKKSSDPPALTSNVADIGANARPFMDSTGAPMPHSPPISMPTTSSVMSSGNSMLPFFTADEKLSFIVT